MYDLETLRILNERAVMRAVSLTSGEVLPSVQANEEVTGVSELPTFPLSILARKLLGGPPSLAYFIALIEQSQNFKEFRNLVTDYLPEHEVDIMAEDIDRRAWRFCLFFSQKFFPLQEETQSPDFTMGDLLNSIPFQPMGFSYEAYHGFTNLRTGFILALALMEAPWEEDPLGMEDEEDEKDGIPGSKIPILEAAGAMVGEGLIRLIPNRGWTAGDLHRLTDGTEFDGLGSFAEWVAGETGLIHLDTRGDYLEMGEPIPWEPEEVDALTNDWHQSVAILDKIYQAALVLEQDPEATFRRLMALLLDKKDLVIPKE